MQNVKHDAIYFSALELQYFNILLSDYSMFQFTLTSEEPEPELRLCYIPNPSANFEHEPSSPQDDIKLFEDMFKRGEIDFEDFSQAVSEIELGFYTPIVRVDVSFNQFQRINHPVAHMHIGLNNSSRIGLNRVWTPHLFTLFIVQNFYQGIWNKSNDEGYSLENTLKNAKSQSETIPASHFCQLQADLINLK